jgi:hypothetical protein
VASGEEKLDSRLSDVGSPKGSIGALKSGPTPDSRGNGVATAEDFRKYMEAEERSVRVALPKSGLAVLLRPPNALRVLLVSERLESLAHAASTPEERRDYVELLARLVTDVMVEPKLSLAPRNGELDPRWLAPEDAEFLLKWALGALSPEGDDLSGFFRADS